MKLNKFTIKKIFDYSLALLLCLLLCLPMFFIWILASISTSQNGWFVHKRIGKNGKTFGMYKFRTLKGNYINPITTEKTHNVTLVGKLLIRYKLDELPQLFNILNGEMSFVGPRPDVSGYADELVGEDRIILTLNPGITGPAQLKYRNENELLKKAQNPKQLNDEVLWPDKVKINKKYIENWSFINDIKYLIQTVFG